VIRLPIAHKEGRYMAAPAVLAALNSEKKVVFRFSDPDGRTTEAANPNGSAENITGVLGKGGNFLAMMPHPERASEGVLGSEDGKKIFLSMIRYIEANG
jgi:phosphoribosylformylglycinamidine (FGAM) synthase-like amidotransferase family enzyme